MAIYLAANNLAGNCYSINNITVLFTEFIAAAWFEDYNEVASCSAPFTKRSLSSFV
jgi:hypothetical protein